MRVLEFVALVLLAVSVASAQTSAPPEERVTPLHSTGEVSKLPPLAPEETSSETTKPLRVPDPEGLQRWKQFLEQTPGAVAPAPGFVDDKK